MKKRRSSKNLMSYTEKYAISLLSEATGGRIGPVQPQKVDSEPQVTSDGMQFSDKRALLDSLTRLLAIKHRIDPEQEESTFMDMREELNGASRETKGRANGSGGFAAFPNSTDANSATDES